MIYSLRCFVGPSPWVGGLAFLIVLIIATWRIVDWRSVAIDRERAEIQRYVEDSVASWEERALYDLNVILENAAFSPAQAQRRQEALRKSRPWFNSLYIWELDKDPAKRQLVFPVAKGLSAARREIERRPCIQRAQAETRQSPFDPLRVAQAYTMGCRFDPHPLVRLYASTEAAFLYRAAQHPRKGLLALQMANLPREASLAELKEHGFAAREVAAYRFMEASLLLDLGNQPAAMSVFSRLGREIVELDAPELAIPLELWLVGSTGIISKLREHGRSEEAAELEQLTARAQRRLVAYREVVFKVRNREPDMGAEPRFIRDQYSDDNPWVLCFGWSRGLGVALQLEQQGLIDSFFRQLGPYKGHVTILGERDQWVAGARGGGPFEIYVPFTGTLLSHLRVGVRASALEKSIETANEQTIALLFIITVGALLGLGALATQVQLSRRQTELISRQRAFTTRVTHELKTPLAGIRVMAENLETGAFRTDEQRIIMARRIVDEADRLKARVDEVLSVAQQRTIPSPTIYDPEEAVLEAIDQWGPRLETAGVQFHADLHPTDMVLGDMAALRDAVGCLLDNALKYRREGRTAQVWLELNQSGRNIEISVADNGLGVPKAMRKSIFQRFVRVEGPNRGKSGGHGLGLNQVREIVEAHRGSVQCVEGEDGGARFIIRLPVQRTPRA